MSSAITQPGGVSKEGQLTNGPSINRGGIVTVSEYEFGRAVVPRTDVAHIRLALHELFGTTEVTQLQHVRVRVAQQVLRLDVSVTNSDCVNVSKRAQHLVCVELDDKRGHHLLHFEVALHNSVYSLWDVVHDDVEINFLCFVTGGVECMAHSDDVRVVEFLHDLELAVFVAAVLINFLDGDGLPGLSYFGLRINYSNPTL